LIYILRVTKVVVLKWWALETRMSPKKADITRIKRLEIGMFEEKPIHFLMQTQVRIYTLHYVYYKDKCQGWTYKD
jgi:hypothetical protein